MHGFPQWRSRQFPSPSGRDGFHGTNGPGCAVLATHQLERHQRGPGIVADPGLDLPYLNVDAGMLPTRHPLGALPPGHAFVPAQRLKDDPPCPPLAYEGDRDTCRRCTDINTFHGAQRYSGPPTLRMVVSRPVSTPLEFVHSTQELIVHGNRLVHGVAVFIQEEPVVDGGEPAAGRRGACGRYGTAEGACCYASHCLGSIGHCG